MKFIPATNLSFSFSLTYDPYSSGVFNGGHWNFYNYVALDGSLVVVKNIAFAYLYEFANSSEIKELIRNIHTYSSNRDLNLELKNTFIDALLRKEKELIIPSEDNTKLYVMSRILDQLCSNFTGVIISSFPDIILGPTYIPGSFPFRRLDLKFWGDVGAGSQNNLGKLLMQIRKSLIESKNHANVSSLREF